MFMSGNICTMVNLFDKTVAEGARSSLWKRGRKVTTRHRNIAREPASQPVTYMDNSIALVGRAPAD